MTYNDQTTYYSGNVDLDQRGLSGASTFPLTIEASHLQIMSANQTVYNPNISIHA